MAQLLLQNQMLAHLTLPNAKAARDYVTPTQSGTMLLPRALLCCHLPGYSLCLVWDKEQEVEHSLDDVVQVQG